MVLYFYLAHEQITISYQYQFYIISIMAVSNVYQSMVIHAEARIKWLSNSNWWCCIGKAGMINYIYWLQLLTSVYFSMTFSIQIKYDLSNKLLIHNIQKWQMRWNICVNTSNYLYYSYFNTSIYCMGNIGISKWCITWLNY